MRGAREVGADLGGAWVKCAKTSVAWILKLARLRGKSWLCAIPCGTVGKLVNFCEPCFFIYIKEIIAPASLRLLQHLS